MRIKDIVTALFFDRLEHPLFRSCLVVGRLLDNGAITPEQPNKVAEATGVVLCLVKKAVALGRERAVERPFRLRNTRDARPDRVSSGKSGR